jgi:hypothetical protein
VYALFAMRSVEVVMVNEICTTITFRNENGEYSVKQYRDEMDIYTVVEDLIIPVLLAAGYSIEVITKALGE